MGTALPYEMAFLRTYGKHPAEITRWWRNRRILLRLAEECNTATPLLVANRVSEVLTVIPDYDPMLRQAQKAKQREAAA